VGVIPGAASRPAGLLPNPCSPPTRRTRPPGIFRATRLRVNPRQRAMHALFKTYLDVVHVARADEAKMFAPAPK
jgi:hypothetical protein